MDPSGQRFRRLPAQIRRGAAEHQEARPSRRAVGQHTQDGKQVGATLNLVDDDQAPQVPERQHRVFEQPAEVRGVLQVQPMHGPAVCARDQLRQRSLADLPQPQDGHHRKQPQPLPNGAYVVGPGHHRQPL